MQRVFDLLTDPETNIVDDVIKLTLFVVSIILAIAKHWFTNPLACILLMLFWLYLMGDGDHGDGEDMSP